jgi:hypothetical protein
VTVVSHPSGKLTLLRKFTSVVRGSGWLKEPEREPSFFDGLAGPHHVLAIRSVTDRDVPNADVVITTWWTTAEWVAELSPRKGAEADFIQHYELFDYTPHRRVKSGYNGYIVPVGNAEALADRLVDVFALDEAKWRAMPNALAAAPVTLGTMRPICWRRLFAM